jgi:hypothetical protein
MHKQRIAICRPRSADDAKGAQDTNRLNERIAKENLPPAEVLWDSRVGWPGA